MNERSAPRSIEQYLEALRAALAGEDPALVQDALYDAEEYLRAEVAANPDRSEADTLELIASTYGAPDEVAGAYRTTEKQVRTALAPPPRKVSRTAFGRFFAVYGDSRTWTALFYMLLALVTGIFYFTATVAGLSMSAGLMVMIIGIPVFLLFVGFTRVLALAEGRLVEGLLGQRMPRRPVYPSKGTPIFERIKDMLTDRRTWTTMFYFLLMLPLGILYFTTAITGIAVSLGLTVGSIASLLLDTGFGHISIDNAVYFGPSPALAPLLFIAGILLLTAVMHLVRGIGRAHGTLAKHLLVAPRGAA
ncbi:MAG: Sensor protein [Steroidobacteraceae bacterium]|nr:Sensor protein [Steroidobacteraceae bacterium]MBM2853681.1 Sensor protein [Steroidobacteraceae bacterium]